MEIPEGLLPFERYKHAASVADPISRNAKALLLTVYHDVIEEYAMDHPNTPEQVYVDQIRAQRPQFPRRGAQDTLIFADSLYDGILFNLMQGNITTEVPNQLALCALLYSQLEGEHAEQREKQCRSGAVHANRILQMGKVKPKTEKPAVQKEEVIKEPPKPEAKPREETPLSFLESHGFRMPESIPICSGSRKSIQGDLDLAVFYLKKGDLQKGKELLVSALNGWK